MDSKELKVGDRVRVVQIDFSEHAEQFGYTLGEIGIVAYVYNDSADVSFEGSISPAYMRANEIEKIEGEHENSGGTKHDQGKTRCDLLPPDALTVVSDVFTFGAQKYGDRNWEKGMKRSRLAGALLRHVFARMRGERDDPETGLPHLAHAGCCVLMWLSHDIRNLGEDDIG